MDADVVVIAARGAVIPQTRADGDASIAPTLATEVAVFEGVVADFEVAHAALLVPKGTITLKQDGGSGSVEVVAVDGHLGA